MEKLTRAEKKRIVMDRICRVLTSKKDQDSECILGIDARRIVDCWFTTVNGQFGGKTPEECLDMDFDKLLEYIEYLDRNYLHENTEEQAFRSADDDVRRVSAPSK
jgi:hypothetical protein